MKGVFSVSVAHEMLIVKEGYKGSISPKLQSVDESLHMALAEQRTIRTYVIMSCYTSLHDTILGCNQYLIQILPRLGNVPVHRSQGSDAKQHDH